MTIPLYTRRLNYHEASTFERYQLVKYVSLKSRNPFTPFGRIGERKTNNRVFFFFATAIILNVDFQSAFRYTVPFVEVRWVIVKRRCAGHTFIAIKSNCSTYWIADFDTEKLSLKWCFNFNAPEEVSEKKKVKPKFLYTNLRITGGL